MAFAVADRQVAGSAEAARRRTVRVALVQASSAVGTRTFDPRDDNMDRALAAIDRAAGEGAGLVVFGEMYLSGYRTDEWLHRWGTVIDPPDAHVSALVERAARHRVTVLMGAGTFGPAMPGDVYNSTLVVTPDGLAGAYRKCHVAAFPYSDGVSLERCFYSPGRDLPVWDTPVGRLGVHICYDMSFPEVARVQTLKGADMLVNTSGSAAGFEEYWDHITFARATENLSWYVVCSVVGVQRDTVLFGGSRIVDPAGLTVVAAKHNEEDFVVADVDLDRARDVRATSHTLSTRVPELYGPIAQPMQEP